MAKKPINTETSSNSAFETKLWAAADALRNNMDAVVRACQRFHEYMRMPVEQLHLRFAFEIDPPIGLTMEFPRRYGEVETLIVIGYSFPVLNRKVDRELFTAMPKLKSIHVQVTPEYRSEVSSTLFELVKGPAHHSQRLSGSLLYPRGSKCLLRPGLKLPNPSLGRRRCISPPSRNQQASKRQRSERYHGDSCSLSPAQADAVVVLPYVGQRPSRWERATERQGTARPVLRSRLIQSDGRLSKWHMCEKAFHLQG